MTIEGACAHGNLLPWVRVPVGLRGIPLQVQKTPMGVFVYACFAFSLFSLHPFICFALTFGERAFLPSGRNM